MRQHKRVYALLLAILMIATAVLAVLGSMVSISAEGNIQSDSPKKMDAWSSNAEGRGPQQVAEGSVYGIRMSYGAPFDGVEVSMPTWSTKDSAATLSIYKWSEGFETTLKSAPIASQVFDPAKDNAFNVLRFDEQPAGEYLVTISGVRGQVGVWKTNVTVGKGFTYMDGAETQADWEMRVYFTKTPVEPFLPCESANAVSGDHVLPPEAELPADSLIYTHEVMPDTWVFTDGLGRVSVTNAEVGDPKEDKTLAMFYWTWHTKAMAAAGTPIPPSFWKSTPRPRTTTTTPLGWVRATTASGTSPSTASTPPRIPGSSAATPSCWPTRGWIPSSRITPTAT